MKKLLMTVCVLAFILKSNFLLSQIKEMDIPFSEFSYNGNSCSGYKFSSGSLIFIPEDAFTFDDGSSCKGKIIIKYRELLTKADMLVSGINMIYMKEGKRKMLESAGMFEIKAECGGKELQLKKGKYIQIRMKCLNELKGLEAYLYDYKNKFWTKTASAVTDFSFRAAQNNIDNIALWGSVAVSNNNTTINQNMDVDMIDTAYNRKIMTQLMGNLPEGYIKGMNISKTGLYNYDAILNDAAAVPIIATFKTTTGEDISEKIYVAYTNKNTLIYYFPEDMSTKFALLPEKGIRIFCLYPDGSVAVLKESELNKINLTTLSGQKHTFVLERQPIKPKDKIALEKAVNIK